MVWLRTDREEVVKILKTKGRRFRKITQKNIDYSWSHLIESEFMPFFSFKGDFVAQRVHCSNSSIVDTQP